ncbi:MAG: BtrH N-terminal domain-containing protein [Candidatus Promineifilaceae bacterium]
MTILNNYQQFSGHHYETGSLHNILAYLGAKNPATGQPLSEALLLGISGGITLGYFPFAYQGYTPHLALLTRNTFDPLQTIYDRLALPHEVQQTTKAENAEAKLAAALERGDPALVWVDMFSLPYNGLGRRNDYWAMIPVVVYGLDGERAYLADQSARPHIITREQLNEARGRVKEDRYRLITFSTPHPEQLPSAIQKGLWQCINLFTEAPPKGARHNFGFAAYQHWANLLTNTRNKQGWERFFPAGTALYTALAGDSYQPGIYGWINTWGTGPNADRDTYADFLDEAALVLAKPTLKDVAGQFRQAAMAWGHLAQASLPDTVPLFKESRELKHRRRQLAWELGDEAHEEIRAIQARLDKLKNDAAAEFPLTPGEVTTFREHLRDLVLTIHDLELTAVTALQTALR